MGRTRFVSELITEEYIGAPQDGEAAEEFEQQLENAAIQGMVGMLDAYSAFLPAAESTELTDQLEGQYEGIGVWVDLREERIIVISAMPGSPAEEAGILPGDVLLAADGVSLEGMTADEALTLVRGPEGSFVELTVQRAASGAVETLRVQRRAIPLHSVQYARVPGTNVGYIKVTIFSNTTTDELDAALQRAEQDGMQGLILDLRDNGGGWVIAAQEMLGRFVPAEAGPALLERESLSAEATVAKPILAEGPPVELPLVVLVNEGTASSAEIVAGALQDYGRATIVGETTFGKGSVQRIYTLDDGSSVRITFAEWLTPSGRSFQGIGISPDIEVAPTGTGGEDLAVARALDELGVSASASPLASPVGAPVGSPSASPVAQPELSSV